MSVMLQCSCLLQALTLSKMIFDSVHHNSPLSLPLSCLAPPCSCGWIWTRPSPCPVACLYWQHHRPHSLDSSKGSGQSLQHDMLLTSNTHASYHKHICIKHLDCTAVRQTDWLQAFRRMFLLLICILQRHKCLRNTDLWYLQIMARSPLSWIGDSCLCILELIIGPDMRTCLSSLEHHWQDRYGNWCCRDYLAIWSAGHQVCLCLPSQQFFRDHAWVRERSQAILPVAWLQSQPHLQQRQASKRLLHEMLWAS